MMTVPQTSHSRVARGLAAAARAFACVFPFHWSAALRTSRAIDAIVDAELADAERPELRAELAEIVDEAAQWLVAVRHRGLESPSLGQWTFERLFSGFSATGLGNARCARLARQVTGHLLEAVTGQKGGDS